MPIPSIVRTRSITLAALCAIGGAQPPPQCYSQTYPNDKQLPTLNTIMPNDEALHQITRPAPAEKIVIGHPFTVLPYVNPNGDIRNVNYYLIDSDGNSKVLFVNGWAWCGSGDHRSNEKEIPFDKYMDGSLLIPGQYKLVVTRGAQGQGAPLSSGKIVAQSKYFQLVQNPTNHQAAGIVSGKLQTNQSGLSAEDIRRCLAQIRYSISRENDQLGNYKVTINPAEDGSFKAALAPGDYNIRFLSTYQNEPEQRLALHITKSWLDLVQPELPQKFTVKDGQTITLNPVLTKNEAETSEAVYQCDISYSP